MKLSKAEIETFFRVLKITECKKTNSLNFLNKIIISVAKYIPWQNITMIENGLGYIPTFEDVKNNMITGKGGICLDINRFMFYFLTQIGYEVHYILCGRKNEVKRHIALLVSFNGKHYFTDFGDAQPYYKAIKLINDNIITRGNIKYKIKRTENTFQILVKKNNTNWNIQYEFSLTKYSEKDFNLFIDKYYNNIFYGPFWKAVHFAYYPNKKLRAIKGTTILYEDNGNKIVKIKSQNINKFKQNLPKYFNKSTIANYRFVKAIKKLEKVNLKERFGICLSQKELDLFLMKISIHKKTPNLKFINEFIYKVISKIPFQNFMMHERGFGKIPTQKEIKEDMLSLNGGTCATMNTFLGAVLYKLGFDVSLINGTMMKEKDHIAILLYINNQFYIIDMGDGQPYFEAFPMVDKTYHQPFRVFRTSVRNNQLKVDFLINDKWSTDCVFHLKPKTYNEIYKTLENHYTEKEFGPFWKGVRFAIYPNKKIIALRDKILLLQKNNYIEKITIRDKEHLLILLSRYLPNFKKQIINCYIKTNLL